jgi:membrane protease YdiL (CAAX protease family)
MATLQAEDDRPWGWRPVVVPLAALAALVIATLVLGSTVRDHSGDHTVAYAVGINIAVEILLAVAVWFAGKDIAARYGGWGRTFGLRAPRLADIPYVSAGFAIALAARFVIAIVANVLSQGQAGREAENVNLDHVTPAAVALLVFVAVICAPVIEELVFRGLMLRTFMRAVRFWPAAILSSLVFALLHTYQVSTLAGAGTLAAVVGTLAITNCVLVRLTDRLTPGIAVHAISNGMSVLLLVLLSSG